MKILSFACIIFLAVLAACAEEGLRLGELGPNTDSRKALFGFSGWLLLTTDVDWRKKWGTSATTAPKPDGDEAQAVAKGKHLFALTFFSNPPLNTDGKADVSCDLEVLKPDGSASFRQTDAVCFKGAIKGSAYNPLLSSAIIDFVGDPQDPTGEWMVRVTLHDKVRGITLPLETVFTLQE